MNPEPTVLTLVHQDAPKVGKGTKAQDSQLGYQHTLVSNIVILIIYEL